MSLERYQLAITFKRPGVKSWKREECQTRAASEHEARRSILLKYLAHGYQVKEICLECMGA